MTARNYQAPGLWPAAAEPLPMFEPDALPAPTAEHIDKSRQDDHAKYARAVAAGLYWYCPRKCTQAHRDECSCPCGRTCHMAGYCPGHR